MNWFKRASGDGGDDWEEEEEEGSDYPLDELAKPVPYSRICYHGSRLFPGVDEVPSVLDTGWTDWEAVWVTDNEAMAEEFCDYAGDMGIPIKYRINLELARALAFEGGDLWIFDELGYGDDVRVAIPLLVSLGYDGWITTGSLGWNRYRDIAVFDDLSVDDVALKIGDEWTDWMSPEEADDLAREHGLFSESWFQRSLRRSAALSR